MFLPQFPIIPIILPQEAAYTSRFILGPFGPGISNESIKLGCFIHIHGGRLYGIKITGQVLWEIVIVLKGLKPSEAKPSRTLRASQEKLGY